MTTDIVPVGSGLDVMSLGSVLARSGYFQDAKDEAQAVVKILAGQEIGIGAIAAMTGIYIVKGRVTLSANLMAAQIKRSGKYDYRITRLDDQGCEITFYQAGQPIGTSSFTEADAKAASLLSGDNWRKFPRNMYFARAMSNGAKWHTPDVFSSPVYTPEELSNEPSLLPPAPPVNEHGEVLTTVVQSAPQLPTAQPKPQATPQRNGNGTDKTKYVNAVRAFIDCASAIGIEVADIGNLDTYSVAQLTDAGQTLRSAIVTEIGALAEEAGEDFTVAPKAQLMKMKPDELQTIGQRLIAEIAASGPVAPDALAQQTLVEVEAVAHVPYDGEAL